MSRNANTLNAKVYQLWQRFDEKMKAAGLTYVLTCTDRTITEQTALYAQGRQPLAEVNRLRKLAGLYLFKSDVENKNKVTWTMKSKHITYPADPDPAKHFSSAFDIAIVKGDRAQWDLKVDVNANDVPDYAEAGKIWESLGGTWGGRWKTPDCPHFEA